MNALIMFLLLSGCVLGGYLTVLHKSRRYYAVVFVTMLAGFLFFPLWSKVSVCEAFVIGMLLRFVNYGHQGQVYRWQVTKTVWLFVNPHPLVCRQNTTHYFQAQLFIFGVYKEKQP